MKLLIYRALIAWIIMTGLAFAGEETRRKEGGQVNVVQKSKFAAQMSYALGYDVFTHVREQVDLDMDAFIRGVRDARKQTPELEPDQMRQLLAAYQRMARTAAREKARALRETNLAQGGVFLEGNKLKAGVVVLSSGLQYKVLKEGTGAVPGPEDSVECHYRGRLLDGREFDSSFSRGKIAKTISDLNINENEKNAKSPVTAILK